jgi:hypothetical protein
MEERLAGFGKIRKRLEGQACPSCGWFRYRVVFRCEAKGEEPSLVCRCSWCGREREATPDLQNVATPKAGAT